MTNPAVIDLLGLLAYNELASFEQMAKDAQLAPDLGDKAEMSKFAKREYSNYKKISKRLISLGSDPVEAMKPFVAAIEGYHANLEQSSWLEGLVKAYIGEGIAADFYRETTRFLDDETSALIEKVLEDKGLADFAIERIRQACENDSVAAGRLALWGRRMMGEMIAQAGQVAIAQTEIAQLFISKDSATSISDDISSLVNKLTVGHARRMDVLGFAS